MDLMPLIEQAREAVDPDCVYDSLCFDVSENLSALLTEAGVAHDVMHGAWRDGSHVYIVMNDGTIIDPTLDQFYPGGRGNHAGDWNSPVWNAERDNLPGEHPCGSGPAIISPSHPFAQHYDSHMPLHWLNDEPRCSGWVEGQEPAWWQERFAPITDPNPFEAMKIRIGRV